MARAPTAWAERDDCWGSGGPAGHAVGGGAAPFPRDSPRCFLYPSAHTMRLHPLPLRRSGVCRSVPVSTNHPLDGGV